MFDDISPESLKAQLLSGLSGWSTQPGSFADIIVSAAAFEIWKCYAAMDALLPMFYIDESSGEYIDRQCAAYGITRKPGARATVSLSLTGDAGTLIPAGTGFCTADGYCFLTDGAVRLQNGTGAATATAEQVGTVYNVPVGTVVSPKFIIYGLSAVSNPQAAAGGIDAESDGSLVNRFYAQLRTPPTSGNAYHYKQWALEVTGVGYAKVLPLWSGPGTVKVLLAGNDGRTVNTGTVTAAVENIEAKRPIGAVVTVAPAAELKINVLATVTVDGSTTKEKVRFKLAEAVDEYLKSLIFAGYTVNYNRISFLLLSIPGLMDFSALTVNGGTGNISVADGQIPVINTVEVT